MVYTSQTPIGENKRTLNEEWLVLQEVYTGVEGYLSEWTRHYNYERPNMGIENEVPASRFGSH